MGERLSQHFLKDLSYIERIVGAAELTPSDTVLEIGPGRGALTQLAAPRSGRFIAVELDEALASRLARDFASLPHVEILQADFLDVDLLNTVAPGTTEIKVLGNLPYAVTSPILEKLMPWSGWSEATLMVQKEVGERLLSAPGSRAYGILSIAVQIYAKVSRLFEVPPGAFHPPPKVDSMVLRLERRAAPLVSEAELRPFFAVVRGAFQHRRKTVLNAIGCSLERPKTELKGVIESLGLNPGDRPEQWSWKAFLRLSRTLFRNREPGFRKNED